MIVNPFISDSGVPPIKESSDVVNLQAKKEVPKPVVGSFQAIEGPVPQDFTNVETIKHIEELSAPVIEPRRESQLPSRVKQFPNALKGVINFTKVVWAIAWTIVRLVITLSVLPVAYPVYMIGKVTAAAVTALRHIGTDHAREPNLEARDHINSTKKPLRDKADVMENLKNDSRRDPDIRQAYFDYYSGNVDALFSSEGLSQSGVVDGPVDPAAVKISREAYINLNLVYRFDGPDMVGRELNLIHGEGNLEEVVRYRVGQYFQDDLGLVGYGLIPVDPESTAPPRLIFRGTSGSSFVNSAGVKVTLPTGYAGDSAGSIGKQSYENKKDDIADWLRAATNNGEKKAFVSGHSLGGAITQRIAADHPNLVGEVFTMGSPRLHRIDLRNVEVGDMKITHLITKKDVFVPRVGGSRLSRGGLLTNGRQDSQEVVLVQGGGHTSKMLNDYCMRGSIFHFRCLSTRAYIARDIFWPRIHNFIRPNINFV